MCTNKTIMCPRRGRAPPIFKNALHPKGPHPQWQGVANLDELGVKVIIMRPF
jgi:hypothetical protein